MTLKKIKLTVKQGKKPINPQEIFNKLTLRGSIENIWQPQSDALDKWHKTRSNQDTVIQMNTGGGKTLVGLLIAQSLVNETKGSVLYVCPNNQLVEQIKDRAKEIALSPAIRYKGKWEGREDYEAGNTFCVTNYATVFHGTSLFRNDNIDALIFDDAHVAEDAIRNQFTLKIERDHKAFGKILHLFRDHFAKTSHAERFEDITEGRFTSSLFIPMFVTWKHAQMLRRILIDCKIADKKSTMFIWEHLKEHLNLCAIVIDGNGLEITPAVLPLTQLSYFQDEIRRVYLTATLPSRASFVRTFGVENPTVIQPSGKSGDAQRLFVFVPGDDDAEQRNEALELVKDYKSCVISPSNSKGQEWDPPATIYDKDSGQEGIDRFRHSQEPEMLGLIARYDGIDLPGDSCRILILDRLPTGESLLNRFIDENMRIETIRITNITTRLVQAIGRIFRSNTDHGVVLLV
ncbi:MAG: DEAD/DEAH box helicase family protein, partial [Candidatus Babeliales bacterium]